ncbi:hypothetical protein [Clostridioides sp. ZZV14-6387]|uniref:hypothetical protein n=1 Tax=Clostridioides sp. ZZV14-6387 TaxID=2811497 RepID=UPI001D1126E2|nr:hypothetical protein [Clostridioides sp. ZZV14-6387]
MPTPSLMQIPKSKSPEEFEDLCSDVLSSFYNTRFILYGKKGQFQSGIDILGQVKMGEYYVAQCKNYFNPKSAEKLINVIKDDIESAENLPFNIAKFIVMTSMDNHTEVHNKISMIKSKFEIELWFWDNIQKEVCQSEYLLSGYYHEMYYNFKLPIEAVNQIIHCMNNLKNNVRYFNNECKYYKVAYNQKSDTELYNFCVDTQITYENLQQLKNQYYSQLSKIDIVETVEEIINSRPVFYDENKDGTGTSMVSTLHEHIQNFTKYNINELVENCNKVIKEISLQKHK